MTCRLCSRAAFWGPVILAAWCRSLAGQAAGATEPTALRPVTMTAGAQYRAGWLHRWLLGAHYRDLWTTPLQVDVVDLARCGGGLAPLKRGGGRQTKSLRLQAADGHVYIFRSVDKDPTAAIPPELRATFVQRILEDQTSSTNPAGALVVGPLLGAAGVHHVEPRLMVMPDDPRLDSFPVFKGMLGHLEERPTVDPEEDVGFERAVWDSVAAALQAGLADSVIDRAVHRLPPEYYARNGTWLARALKRRRDDLRQVADRYYALLAGAVDVQATDEADVADVQRQGDGSVTLRLARRDGTRYYVRTFHPGETSEVRLYLPDGDDRVVVRGAGPRT